MVNRKGMGKEGIFRTLEVMIAIFITFTFLFVFIPSQREQASPEIRQDILAGLRENEDFRNCVMAKNATCINSSIDRSLADNYGYMVNLSDDPHVAILGLPQKRVYANSIFVSGNTTNATRTIVRLFYWSKG